MDATLLTILVLLALATTVALIQARRRDPCLTAFEGFHVTLASKEGHLAWGQAHVYTSGIEVAYAAPVQAREGHLEHSFIFYRDQFEAMDALYRYADGLDAAQQQARQRVIRRTARPGLWRRLRRHLRNGVGMVRDALLQAVSLLIGAARTRRPGAAVLSNQEAQIKALSSEIIGHAGNAYDPLLERHLFSRVVLEVTRNGQTFSYCGWLKDYTSQFIEVVDATANVRGAQLPLAGYALGDERLKQVALRKEGRRLTVANGSDHLLHVQRLEADDWTRPMGCVLPPQYAVDLTLPVGVNRRALRAWIGSVERVDVVVPRTHALVRHAAGEDEAPRPASSEQQAPAPPARRTTPASPEPAEAKPAETS